MAEVRLDAIKRQSEERLIALGAGLSRTLPPIEDLTEVHPRSARDAAGRACVISYIIGIGYDADREELKGYLSRYDLGGWVSTGEHKLLDCPAVSDQDKINCTWLSECAQALAWALGLVELDCRRPCDDNVIGRLPLPKTDPGPFITAARLRPITEIQAEVDFHFRLHWWTRQCELNGVDCSFSNSIVLERRRALDWLYGVESDWDAISLDT